MKNLKFLSLIILVLSTSFSSCIDDDEPATDFVEFGEIDIRIEINQGSEELIKTLGATAVPSNVVITYLNNGEEFTSGPEVTVQGNRQHNLRTRNGDASSLNVGFQGIVPNGEEIDVAYVIIVNFNSNRAVEQSFEFRSSGFVHSFEWSTLNGFAEELFNSEFN